MKVEIILEKIGESQCTVYNTDEKDICYIEIKEGNRDIMCKLSITEMRHALRKLTVE